MKINGRKGDIGIKTQFLCKQYLYDYQGYRSSFEYVKTTFTFAWYQPTTACMINPVLKFEWSRELESLPLLTEDDVNGFQVDLKTIKYILKLILII